MQSTFPAADRQRLATIAVYVGAFNKSEEEQLATELGAIVGNQRMLPTLAGLVVRFEQLIEGHSLDWVRDRIDELIGFRPSDDAIRDLDEIAGKLFARRAS